MSWKNISWYIISTAILMIISYWKGAKSNQLPDLNNLEIFINTLKYTVADTLWGHNLNLLQTIKDIENFLIDNSIEQLDLKFIESSIETYKTIGITLMEKLKNTQYLMELEKIAQDFQINTSKTEELFQHYKDFIKNAKELEKTDYKNYKEKVENICNDFNFKEKIRENISIVKQIKVDSKLKSLSL